MSTNRSAIVSSVVVLAIVATACGTNTSKSTGSGGQVRRGGVYRTAISSFGFTGGFDPTGEYLGLAWDFYGAMLRTLVTYRHVAGPAGNVLVPDLATVGAAAHRWRAHVHVPLEAGHRVRPAGVPAHHVAGHRVRLRADRLQARGGPVRVLLRRRSPGHEPARWPARADLGHRHPGRRARSSSTSRSRPGISSTGWRCRPPRPSRTRSAGCFPTGGGYGRDVVSSGPYMIQGSPRRRHLILQGHHADVRVRSHDAPHPGPQPELPPGDRQHERPVEPRQRHLGDRRLERDRHLREGPEWVARWLAGRHAACRRSGSNI